MTAKKKPPAKKPAVRKNWTTITEETTRLMMEEIMLGKSLRQIEKMPGMPTKRTIVNWLANPDKKDFQERYIAAKKVQAEIQADEMIEIADDSSGDYETVEREDGSTYQKFNHENVQRSKLKVNTRQWAATRLLSRFGDRVAVTGNDGGPMQVFFTEAERKLC